MCSTPCGVTDMVARNRPSAMRSSLGAQRLAASQTWSLSHVVGIGPARAVLNALRRHRHGRAAMSRPLLLLGRVLNALRRHRHGRMAGDVRGASAEGCSTPCGVTDMVATSSLAFSTSESGAQRLAASQTWSRVRSTGRSPLTCVLNALRRHRHGRRPGHRAGAVPSKVLNALRRHRHGRSSRPSPGRCRGCAQRLAASQTWSHRAADPSRSIRPPSAQRLAASQTWSRVRSAPITRLRRVLNALRRHRHGRMGDHCSPRRHTRVLNALRRHRHGRRDGAVGRSTPMQGAQRLAASQTGRRPPRTFAAKALRRHFSSSSQRKASGVRIPGAAQVEVGM